MTAETILYIVIAAVVALLLSAYLYGYKTKYRSALRWLVGTLRFLTLWALFLLLINPKFRKDTYTIEKPKLPILVDNSSSIKELGQDVAVQSFLGELKKNTALNEKFDLSFFSFGKDFKPLDSLRFDEKQTQIDKALSSTKELFKQESAPTILISDGNQTFGKDYAFSGLTFGNQIYPLMVGDSTRYTDLKIEQLNTNRYSFLKNEFPLEAILVYSGESNVRSRFVVRQGGLEVFSKTLDFSPQNNSQTISATLPSKQVGLQRYTAQIEPIDGERNTNNNSKLFAIEVIDQATKVLVVSRMVHPDMGAIKKAIETNEQRTVTFMKPSEAATKLEGYQLLVLYQPDRSFSEVIKTAETLKKNTWIIAGLQTDWFFLNQVQPLFDKEITNAREEVGATLNLNYGNYALEDFGIENFPPLQTEFGDLSINAPHEVLLQQIVDGFSTGSPLLATIELNGKRDAIWDGEGFWRWRAQTYLATESFQDFDDFIGKLVQYLASNKQRNRLEVQHESFYYNNNPIQVSAQYFDKNFVFDSRAQLEIRLLHQTNKKELVFPMLLRNNYYEVDLSNLPEGDYNFTVSVKDEALSKSGSFTILDFNVEQQFLNANTSKLEQLASQTGGEALFLNDANKLIDSLLNNETYKAIQKRQQKIVPLIDWKYLLVLMALLLSAEWFIRKYNGLI
ncbi:MAG: VWA domain-containing protein [Flavobacteriaceae bacterium]